MIVDGDTSIVMVDAGVIDGVMLHHYGSSNVDHHPSLCCFDGPYAYCLIMLT